jgi:hypothetical protein
VRVKGVSIMDKKVKYTEELAKIIADAEKFDLDDVEDLAEELLNILSTEGGYTLVCYFKKAYDMY